MFLRRLSMLVDSGIAVLRFRSSDMAVRLPPVLDGNAHPGLPCHVPIPLLGFRTVHAEPVAPELLLLQSRLRLVQSLR